MSVLAALSALALAVSAPPPTPLDPGRLEIAGLPAITYDTNVGVGVGALLNFAQFAPGQWPYDWRLTFQIYLTLDTDAAGEVRIPFHNHWVAVDLPGLLGGGLRLQAKAGFRRFSTLGYYGVGNAARVDAAALARAPAFHQVLRAWGFLESLARVTLWRTPEAGAEDRFDAFARLDASVNEVTPYGDSLLAEERAGRAGELRRALLHGASGAHGQLEATAGVLWDSRDHETVPSCGQLHDLSLRAGGGLGDAFAYGGFNATARGYQRLVADHLTLAGRVMADLLFGDAPFYLLPRHGGIELEDATGGQRSIRGVDGQRRHGKIKLLANLELRARLWSFEIGGDRFNLGALAFVDGGRVWTDYRARPALDGTRAGIALGAGGGLRVQWGETFLLRIDLAYSPTDETIGFYLDIDHVF